MKLLLVVMLVASVAGEDHEKVHPPTNLTVIRTALNEVKLYWTAPCNNIPPVEGYEVYYGILGIDEDELGEKTTYTHATISGVFTLGVKYQFYVTAYSDMYSTEISDPSNVWIELMDIPWSEEYNVSSDEQTITVSWHSPRFLPSSYDLDIYCKMICNNFPLDPRIIDPPGLPGPESTSVVVNKLVPNGVCFINLTAVYKLTTSETVRSKTLDMTETTKVTIAPETAPIKLRVVSATNTSLSITWRHLPCITTGYNLTCGNSDGNNSKLIPYTYETGKDCIPHFDNGAKRFIIPPPLEDICYTLEGLEPCTEYKLSIAAVNEVGMSDFSSTVIGMTGGCPLPGTDIDEKKVSPPTNLTAIKTALNKVELYWNPPTVNTPRVEAYEVYYTISGNDSAEITGTGSAEFDSAEISPNTTETYAIISDLTLGVTYKFFVIAIGDIFTNPSEPSNIVTMSMDIPQLSQKYNASSTFDTITISWFLPEFPPSAYDLHINCKLVCNDLPLYYVVSDPPGPRDTSVVIEKLSPGAICYVSLTAVYGKERSEPLSIIEKTTPKTGRRSRC